jgi:hypothetical protein
MSETEPNIQARITVGLKIVDQHLAEAVHLANRLLAGQGVLRSALQRRRCRRSRKLTARDQALIDLEVAIMADGNSAASPLAILVTVRGVLSDNLL